MQYYCIHNYLQIHQQQKLRSLKATHRAADFLFFSRWSESLRNLLYLFISSLCETQSDSTACNSDTAQTIKNNKQEVLKYWAATVCKTLIFLIPTDRKCILLSLLDSEEMMCVSKSRRQQVCGSTWSSSSRRRFCVWAWSVWTSSMWLTSILRRTLTAG